MTSQRVDLKTLKRQADFPTILAHYGLTAEGRGNQIKILCPFHAESRASCSINVEKRLFHCFGCDASGNALDFVHRMEALGRRQCLAARGRAQARGDLQSPDQRRKRLPEPPEGARTPIRRPDGENCLARGTRCSWGS